MARVGATMNSAAQVPSRALASAPAAWGPGPQATACTAYGHAWADWPAVPLRGQRPFPERQALTWLLAVAAAGLLQVIS